jgi:hypothetical protein
MATPLHRWAWRLVNNHPCPTGDGIQVSQTIINLNQFCADYIEIVTVFLRQDARAAPGRLIAVRSSQCVGV